MDPGVEDIDLNDPEVQNAALKIQAGFRGHKTRKELHDKPTKKEESPNDDDEVADIDLTDPDLADAALKIQAGFRGHKVRKGMKKEEVEAEINKKMQQLNTEIDDELADINLEDPELNKAATKIQATFRGHKARKDQ